MNMQGTCGCVAATRNGGCHVVRALHLEPGWTDEGEGCAVGTAVVIEVKTTSLDIGAGAIIRLTLRQFEYDHKGAILWLGDLYEWFEDPGHPIPAEVVAATGITDARVRGKVIEDWVLQDILSEASIAITHGCPAVRRRIEQRLGGALDVEWACSKDGVDWYARGFGGCSLRYLLMRCGHHCERRRPGDGVDPVIQVLRHRTADDRTALSELLDRTRAS
ncbi:hypothetical protein [Novosphingobium rosa]|uniref:hypothetical protein n=1 Tax=Novosphingobium rosa TaxID=76978 RepID=UPI0012EE0F65|nr:hypothetical protein [Novosphingobium rosa]